MFVILCCRLETVRCECQHTAITPAKVAWTIKPSNSLGTLFSATWESVPQIDLPDCTSSSYLQIRRGKGFVGAEKFDRPAPVGVASCLFSGHMWKQVNWKEFRMKSRVIDFIVAVVPGSRNIAAS